MQAETNRAYWLREKAKGVLASGQELTLTVCKAVYLASKLLHGWGDMEIFKDIFILACRMIQFE